MSDFCFKLTALAGFYADLNAFTDAYSYARMTDAVTHRLPGDPGTGVDFLAMVQQDATRFDFIHVANLVSMPAVMSADGITIVTPAVTSGPHLTVRASFVNGNNPSVVDQAKMALLLNQLATFFGSQAPATFTPDPSVMSAYSVVARQYPRTANGTWVISPAPAYPKFGW